MARRRKTHKKRRNTSHFLLTFFLTFGAVVLAGLFGFAGYRFMLREEGKSLPSSKTADVFHMFGEDIPQGERPDGNGSLEAAADGAAGDATTGNDAALTGRYGAILADEDYMRENRIYGKKAASTEEVTLAFAGDILLDPAYSVMARLLQRENGLYDSFSSDLLNEMQQTDLFMLNNEFPYSERGTPTPEKQFTFRARPESAGLLAEMGVDLVSLANNHAYDYGEAALLDTLDTLTEMEIPYVGAGRNLEEAARPVYFIINDIKIAFLSATQIERLDNPDTKGATDAAPGVFRCWNPENLLKAIGEVKENCDFLVVYIHWGTENTAELDWAQLDQAPKLVKAGADLIIGDHPHCLQPMEYINGVPVIYSLGNFWFNSKSVDTCLVKVAVDESGLKNLQFLPALQKDCATSLLHGEEKERVLSYMRSLSPKVEIDGDGYVSER